MKSIIKYVAIKMYIITLYVGIIVNYTLFVSALAPKTTTDYELPINILQKVLKELYQSNITIPEINVDNYYDLDPYSIEDDPFNLSYINGIYSIGGDFAVNTFEYIIKKSEEDARYIKNMKQAVVSAYYLLKMGNQEGVKYLIKCFVDYEIKSAFEKTNDDTNIQNLIPKLLARARDQIKTDCLSTEQINEIKKHLFKKNVLNLNKNVLALDERNLLVLWLLGIRDIKKGDWLPDFITEKYPNNKNIPLIDIINLFKYRLTTMGRKFCELADEELIDIYLDLAQDLTIKNLDNSIYISHSSNRIAAYSALGTIPYKSIDKKRDVIKKINAFSKNETDPRVKISIACTLYKLGGCNEFEYIDILIDIFNSSKSNITKQLALEKMIGNKCSKAIQFVENYVNDNNQMNFYTAALLANENIQEGFDWFNKELKTIKVNNYLKDDYRVTLLKRIEQLKNPNLIKKVVEKCLNNENDNVREQAFLTLAALSVGIKGTLKDMEIITRIQEKLSDFNESKKSVKLAAAIALLIKDDHSGENIILEAICGRYEDVNEDALPKTLQIKAVKIKTIKYLNKYSLWNKLFKSSHQTENFNFNISNTKLKPVEISM